jgi:hypothetical protein
MIDLKNKFSMAWNFSKNISIDIILAKLGIVCSIFLIIFLSITAFRPVYVLVGIFSLISFISYLYLAKKNKFPITFTLDLKSNSYNASLLLNIIFFILFSYSLFSFHFRTELYERPLTYFISIILLVIIVAFEILVQEEKRIFHFFILLKVFLIGVSLEWSQILIYPSVVGIDPWWHQMFTSQMLDTGHIPQNYSYSKLPIMHILIGSNSLLMAQDYKTSAMLIVSLSQILIDSMFIFLIGDFLFNKKVGLMAALLVMISNYHIQFGYWSIPNTVGVIFILPIFYFIFVLKNKHSYYATILYLFLMAILILTHTISALSMAILLFICWTGFKVYKYFYQPKSFPINLNLIVLFTTAMFGWWMFASGSINSLAKAIKFGFKIDVFSAINKNTVDYLCNIPLYEQITVNIGMFLLFSLAFIGCLYMISKHGNEYSFVFAIGGMFLLSLGFFSTISGHSIIEHRWWYISEILLSVPLALTLFQLVNAFKSNIRSTIVVAAILFTISFFIVIGPQSNIDNPVFSKSYTDRLAFTESEIYAIKAFSQVANDTIDTDWYATKLNLNQDLNVNLNNFDDSIYTGKFQHYKKRYLLIRNIITNNPFRTSGGIYKLDYSIENNLDNQKFNRIYDGKSVSVYSRGSETYKYRVEANQNLK